VDETTVSLHPPLTKCWMKRGQRKQVPAPGTPRRLHTFGAYNWRDDTLSWQCARRKNSESFIAFVEHLLLGCYPTQRVILVMDNASYHKSKASLAALSLFEDRVMVIWLPAYCPFLNAIERFWLHLKTIACANKLQTDLDALAARIDRTMTNQNCLDHTDRFTFSKDFRLTA
jgi:transposase